MTSFEDNQGRKWDVDVDVHCVKRVRELTSVDLLSLGTGKLTDDLQDVVKLVDVLYVVCKPQADADGVSDVEFGRALRGDSIETSTQALMLEVIRFFPTARRANLQTMWDKGERTRAILNDAVTKAIEEVDPEQLLAQFRSKTSGDRSGSSPESSGSTPDL